MKTERMINLPLAVMAEVSQGSLHSPFGILLLREEEGHLAEVRFAKGMRSTGRPSAMLRKCRKQLTEYFAGKRKSFSLPLKLHGTVFQQRVWKKLISVPFGKTVTYQELARACGHPRAIRAVGNAVAKNPLAIIVPCHRVLPSKGGIGGYAFGAWRKKRLLMREAHREDLPDD